ncbi:MAG TPA: hypothetical protein PKC79_12960 [Solidesulfovibrio magneticus]|nr:hypothetical protein [Solidesulfovibrio magneticus]
MKRLLALPAFCAALLPSLARSLSASALEPDARKELSEFFSPVAAVNMAIFDQLTRADQHLPHFALRPALNGSTAATTSSFRPGPSTTSPGKNCVPGRATISMARTATSKECR